MSQPCIIALDQGTSNCRAALFREGRLAHESRREVGLHFPAPGRAEQDPRELFDASAAVLAETVAALAKGETAVLGITNQRSTVVLWDGETGAPLGPALSWRDSRAQAEAEALANAVSDLAARTGLPSSPHYGAPKISWALQHWPEARRAADAGLLRVGPIGTWLAWKLTRGESFVVDPTNAQRMQLLDLETLNWHLDLVEACSLPPSALPRVLPTDGHFGTAHCGGRELPIRAMLGDQQAALLGLRGEAAPSPVAGVHLGTGGFVLRDTGAEARAVPGLLGGLARADANRPRRYMCEGPVNSAGSAFDRLREIGLLGAQESVDAACARSSRPLTVLPAWAGLAAPWWQATARAAMAGWDESTTADDVVAGTVRGVAFLIADVVDRLREFSVAVDRLELSGPVSGVAVLGQAIADACELPASVRTNPEASLEGIAMLAASAAGLEPLALSIEQGRRFEPGATLHRERAAFARLRTLAIEDSE